MTAYATHQLLKIYADGTTGHVAWLTDPWSREIGRLIERQYLTTMWILRYIPNGHETYIASQRRSTR